ncbi:MAG TPA: outer membrane lipoprotein carrier protein LolA [Verrucomicrobiae bacterium]|nr:outer membrane lipoprotein carrier protein LolA [Verrucomicrobiae bacterium]
MTNDECQPNEGACVMLSPGRFVPPIVLLLSFVICHSSFLLAAQPDTLLRSWLAAQTNVHTWSAELVQIRSLKTFTQPITNHGRVWFAAPDRFRWEIGSPATTIAVRQPAQLLVIYPKLHRAERYPLDGKASGPWKDTLALLEAGFPRSATELEARFKLTSQGVTNGLCEVVLQPRSASARRMMPQIRVAFATNDFALHATELQFADGSTMRNEFGAATLNGKLDEGLFTPELGADCKLVDPLKKP